MALILSIETATTVCSVALYNGKILLGSQSLFIDKSHSGLLAPSIESLVNYCGYSLPDLEVVAVSEGPGSYTGLRIGIAAAKGLCYALDIPLIGVNTLEAMAYGVNKYNATHYLLCPMIDARRMEVYCLLADHNMTVIEPTHAAIIDEHFLEDVLMGKKILFFGDGSDKCREVIKSDNAVFMTDVKPDAVNIGAIAAEKYAHKDFEDVAYFEPVYLKEFSVSKPKVK